MAFSFISCSVCNKRFLKDNRHINENKKFGHNFYCSIQCQSKVKNKQKELFCDNLTCKKKFKRRLSQLSVYNFCSQSCAAIINNKRRVRNGINSPIVYKTNNQRAPLHLRYCLYCGNRVAGKYKYCSMKCWGKDHEIPKEKLISEIILLTKQLNRVPTRRECKHSTACAKQFGSWSQAVIAAGLTPHRSLNQKMYQRKQSKSIDGHFCNSISELIIDNWLYKNKINHQKETLYPKGKFTADWSFSANVFVEYFGLAQDSRRYDQEIEKKRRICKEFNIKLIEIYSKDLFPKNLLKQIFK